MNADPGTRNAEHQIDFLIAWTIDERKDGVAAFCPYVKGVRSISTKPIVLIGRIVVLKKPANLTSSALQREVSHVHASAVYSRHVRGCGQAQRNSGSDLLGAH